MRVLLVRHGSAEDAGYRDGRVVSDEERELTEEGRGEVSHTGRFLARIVPRVHTIVSSPLARAAQTARIIGESYNAGPIDQLKVLVPHGSPHAVLSWLELQDPTSCVCLVGHEPAMGILAGWLMCGDEKALVRFSKGSVCCLEFSGLPSPGTGILRWMISPEIAKIQGG